MGRRGRSSGLGEKENENEKDERREEAKKTSENF